MERRRIALATWLKAASIWVEFCVGIYACGLVRVVGVDSLDVGYAFHDVFTIFVTIPRAVTLRLVQHLSSAQKQKGRLI